MSSQPDPAADVSAQKRALIAIRDLKARLEAAEQARHEPIAIIGMSCRFPAAPDLDSYWRVLSGGVDAIGPVPKDRWDVDAFYDPNPETPGKTYANEGGFIGRVDGFDAGLFGITPREVVTMDPQQRLLLEVSWEALEHAGIAPGRLAGSATSVVVGLSTSDYLNFTVHNPDLPLDAYMGTGGAACVAAGRISFLLGFHGPAFAVDTACSSSLVAVALATEQLRAGKCEMALAGGVNLMLAPKTSVYLSKLRALSPSNRCRAFDAAADGYVRGEGAGMIVLKRLSDAQRDNDRILAVIKGGAINHDGRSSGLTVPNGEAQEAVLQAALRDARVEPSKIQYVEAHGTGTPLGDPIELRALGAVLGGQRSQPFLLGTVKSNIGHLEAAAGIAGVIKVVLAMQRRTIPPSLHFRTPNPHAPWDRVPVSVPTTCSAWPDEGALPLAGVSAFGFSGTNAHVILEAAPAPAAISTVDHDRPAHVLTLSAATSPALEAVIAQVVQHLQKDSAESLADAAFTANTGRTHFEHRIAVVGASTQEIIEELRSLESPGPPRPAAVKGRAIDPEGRRLAFLFTGQGSQYVEMGAELYESSPVFREAFDACDAIVTAQTGQSLKAIVYPAGASESPINETRWTQPALFSVEYALDRLWRSWGLEPAVVFGHSLGEYVAACVAGLFDLEDGLSFVIERSRAMQAVPGGGRMAAVMATEEVVAGIVGRHPGLSIAAVNAPGNVVVSGPADVVAKVIADCAAGGISTQPLVVSHAFHSQQMDPALADVAAAAARVRFRAPRARIISNLTGLAADLAELSRPAYWAEHVRQPVRFADSVKTAQALGCTHLVEVGPHPTLLALASQSVAPGAVTLLPSMRRGASPWRQMLQSLAALHVAGYPVEWARYDAPYGRRRIALPTYPFQRDRYWVETTAAPRVQPFRADADAGHPVLGARVQSPLTRDAVFEIRLTTAAHPFVADHVVFGAPVFPATGYVELARAGGAAVLGGPCSIEDLAIEEALLTSDEDPRLMQLVVTPSENGLASFQVFSRSAVESGGDVAWTRHASGRLSAAAVHHEATSLLDDIRERCTRVIATSDLYERFTARGIDYGPRFRGMSSAWQGENEAIALLVRPEILRPETESRAAHPAFLDAALQVLGAALGMASAADEQDDLYLPVAIERLWMADAIPDRVWSHASLRGAGGAQTLTAELRWYDDEGRTLLMADGVVLKRASSEALRRAADRKLREWVYEVDWPVVEASGVQGTLGTWIVAGESTGLAAQVLERFGAAGASGVQVSAGPDYRFEPGRAWLDPGSREQWLRLLTDIGSSGPIAGVIHLWSVDCPEPRTAGVLDEVQAAVCGSALALLQALGNAGQPSRVTFVTRGAQAVGLAPWPTRADQTALWGLARAVAAEQPQMRCTVVDLDPGDPLASAQQVVAEALAASDETQVAFRGGERHAARLVRASKAHGTDRRLAIPGGESFQLTTTARGVLENLAIESRPRVQPGRGQVEMRVHATGLNFRDVLNALGMYPGDPGAMGGECAGQVTRVGEGVTGLRVGDAVLTVAGGSFSKYVVVPAAAAVALPAAMSYEQGASIPVTFLTAYYGLHQLAGIKKGDRVLVHAAAGGVGQAAVQIAVRAGAEVYGTAGSAEKRAFVKAMGARAVFSSRTADFEDELRGLTDGHGVDIVLNSLTGAFIPKSLNALAPGGHFLEIGKAEIWTPEAAAAVNPRATYTPFDLGDVVLHDLPLLASMFAEVMRGLADGSLRTLPMRVFDFEDAISAFRFMAQAKHVGKIVLTQRDVVRDESPGEAGFDADGTYLVTGGCGGLGLKVAGWMVGRGARHLVLTGRSAPTAAAARAIEEMTRAGATVTVAQADVSREADVRRVLATIDGAGAPLRGVLHAAGVLDDGVLAEQTWSRFAQVLAPKVRGGWLLHELTRDRRLDCFVLFSSTSAVFGAPGQANYAAANAYLDGLAQYRRASGLTALSVNWGAWSEVGMAARLDVRDRGRLAERGFALIPPDQGARVLGHLMRQSSANAVVVPIRWDVLLRAFPPGGEPPLLRIMARDAGPRQAAGQAADSMSLASRLEGTPASERSDVVVEFVRGQLARVLGLPSGESFGAQTPLTSVGLDSLMAIELRNALGAAVGSTLPASLVYDCPTIEALANRLLEVLEPAVAAPAAVAGRGAATSGPGETQVESIEGLSQEQLAALLAESLTIPGKDLT